MGKRRPKETPSYLNFDEAAYSWKSDVDYKKHPELYRVGRGEQGVLICEPYKSEIGQFWRFKTVAIAEESSSKIYDLFLRYVSKQDFVGADMARKYLQMGFTSARRYANYKDGKKYDKENEYQLLKIDTGQKKKADAAEVFYIKWQLAESNEVYAQMKQDWKKRIG